MVIFRFFSEHSKRFWRKIGKSPKSSFRKNMDKYGCAVYGGEDRIGYYTISGSGMIDIDNEKDFFLAETVLKITEKEQPKQYYEI